MGHQRVNLVGETMEVALLVLLVDLGKCASDVTVFGIGDGVLDVHALAVDRHTVFLVALVFHQGVAALLVEMLGNLVTHLEHAAVGVVGGDELLHLLVVLEQLDAEETGGEFVAETVGVEFLTHLVDAGFQFLAVVDVNVADGVVLALVDLDNLAEQVVDTLARTPFGGDDGHTEQRRELVAVELVAMFLELVEDVQRHHHRDVHVDKLGGEVEIAFQVGGVDHVEDDVGMFLYDMFADIEFFGRVGTETVGAWQINQIERVATKLEGAHLLVDGDAAVVAHPFMGMCRNIEDAGLAAVGVAHQRHVDGLASQFSQPFGHRTVVGRKSGLVGGVVCQPFLGFLFAHNLHMRCVVATEAHLEVHHSVFDRVFEGRIQHSFHFHTTDKAHFDDAFAESTIAVHLDNNALFSCL